MVRNQEIVEDFTPQDGLGHDPRHVLELDSAVPDPLRVDDHGRAVFALLEAAGMIGTCQQTKASGLELLLERLTERLTSIRVATTSLVAGVTDITTDENMMCKCRHLWATRHSEAFAR